VSDISDVKVKVMSSIVAAIFVLN